MNATNATEATTFTQDRFWDPENRCWRIVPPALAPGIAFDGQPLIWTISGAWEASR